MIRLSSAGLGGLYGEKKVDSCRPSAGIKGYMVKVTRIMGIIIVELDLLSIESRLNI